MDEEILKAFGKISEKLGSLGITQDSLVKMIKNPKEKSNSDCLENIHLFFDWYLEKRPLSTVIQNGVLQDNIESMDFEGFLKFERENAGINKDIISDKEMELIYNNFMCLPLTDINMDIGIDVSPLLLNIQQNIEGENRVISTLYKEVGEEESFEEEKLSKKHDNKPKIKPDLEDVFIRAGGGALLIMKDIHAVSTAPTADNAFFGVFSVIFGVYAIYRTYKPKEERK